MVVFSLCLGSDQGVSVPYMSKNYDLAVAKTAADQTKSVGNNFLIFSMTADQAVPVVKHESV